jgi:hypothetical protein
MTTIWEFSINGTIVSDPIGWDAVEFTLQRDPVYSGLENILSDGIKFWDDGAALIKAEYELNGIDGQLNFLIRYSCDQGVTYNTLFSGILNCFYYEIINNEVSIKIEPSGFHRLVKNRLSTPINLNSNISIDGLPMSNINPFDLGLHSKAIVQKSNLLQNDQLLTISDTHDFNTGDDVAIGIYFPLQISTSELARPVEETNLFHYGELGNATDPIFIQEGPSGNITVDYKLKATFNEAISATRSYGFVIVLSYGDDGSQNSTNIFGPTFFGRSGGTTSQAFDISGSVNIPLNTGQKVFIDIRISNYSVTAIGTQPATFSLVSDGANHVNFTQSTIASPSTCKALLIHEAFAKIAESMTGIQDSFRSNFFGRTNSEPNQYLENGCGAWTAISNGLNIRKMLDKNSVLFPITTTFTDLFSAADAVWNLGMKIEKDGTGKEYIRVEPKEYFYNARAIKTVLQVSDLKVSPAQDLIFNTFAIGYTKWNLNITGSNAIDEFNSDRSYTIPVKNAAQNLSKMSDYIASGYAIEQTRRLQYQSAPTNDFETDNDLFFICTNRAELTSNLYTTPPVATVYEAGTVSERDENFIAIDKVLNYPTSYNLRISPARMAGNWYKYLAASIFKHPTGSIKFASGTGNYQELDTMINDCIVENSVIQNQDLLASNMSGMYGLPIYLPEYLEFTYPLSYEEFLDILAQSENGMQVSCNDTAQYVGFINTLKYSPTTQGGIGSFKLIRGLCVLGDFNNDFNNDFNIGNC